MAEKNLAISVRGKWIDVPAVELGRHTLMTTGKFVRIASIHDEYWDENEVEFPESYIRALKENRTSRFNPDIFTFGQKLPNIEPKYPYRTEWDNVAAIPVSSYDDWWKSLSTDTRRNVKTFAKRGLVTRVQDLNEDLLKGITKINNEAPIRQGRQFWHYGKDIDAVRKDYMSFADRSQYIGAYFEDELIAFMKVVFVGNTVAIMQNLASLAHRDKKAANALVAKAVELCAAKNLSYLTYLQYRYGKRESPLTEFKRRNGFQELRTPRYFVPLTAKGNAALSLGLHHSIGEMVPEKFLDFVLPLRSRWYDWRSGKLA